MEDTMIQATHNPRIARLLAAVPAAAAVLIALVPSTPAQNLPSTTVIKKVPVQQNGEISGARLFQTYCAPCHGVDAKGNGPAAPALRSIPPDLTVLAKFSGGNFPAAHVMSVLTGQGDNTAHGSKDMPIWGPLFRNMADQSTEGAYLRARNVTEYLRSIQEH
jgi:mono/diheme cytochrome c family protein